MKHTATANMTIGAIGFFMLLGLHSNSAVAQEVARVISATPIISQVQVPRQTCALERNGSFQNQVCTTQTVIENRTAGFTVIYEYNGHIFSTQTAYDPGPYIELNGAQQLAGNYGPGYSQPYVQPYVQPYYPQRAYVVPAPVYATPYGRPNFVAPPAVFRGGHGGGNGYRQDFGGHHGGHHGGNGRYEFHGRYR
jgi:hypothetical protein